MAIYAYAVNIYAVVCCSDGRYRPPPADFSAGADRSACGDYYKRYCRYSAGRFESLALITCAIQLWQEYPRRKLFLATSLFVFVFSGLSNLLVIVSQADYGAVLTSFGKAITLGSALLLFSNLTAYR